MGKVDDYGYWAPPQVPGPTPQPIGGPAQPYKPPVTTSGAVGGSTAPPGTLSVGGTHPDYMNLIKQSPAYVAWLASKNYREGNLATNRAAAIRALVLQYGGLPPGFSDAFGDLRAEDMDAASHNQFSTVNQIQRNYEQGVQSMKQALAARGALQSGELGYGQGQQDYSRGLNEYNAGNSFLSALNEALQGYTGGIGSVESEEPGIISGELGNVEAQYPTIQPTSANLVPDSVSKYGFAVYDDGAGGLWKVGPNGPEPFTPPAGGGATPAGGGAPVPVAPGPTPATLPPIIQSPSGPYIQVAGGKKYE